MDVFYALAVLLFWSLIGASQIAAYFGRVFTGYFMSVVLQISIALVFVAVFYKALSRNDRRFDGLRISLIGVMIVFLGTLCTFSNVSPYLSMIGFVTFPIGFILGIVGMVKHSKKMFSSDYMESLDMSADYDYQGFDSKYAICPNCEKSSIKLDDTQAQCPICKAHYKVASTSAK